MADEINLIVAKELNIVVMPKDTSAFRVIWWSDTAKTIPINLSGISFRMMVKAKATDADGLEKVLLTSEASGGITISGADNNIMDIEKKYLVKAKAIGYPYDLQGTDGSDNVTTYLYGKIVTPIQDVTDNANEL